MKLSGRVTVFDAIPGEPDIATLEAALEAARRCRPELIVGLGGGSVLDVAKLVAVLWDSDQTLGDVAGPNRVAGRRTRLVQVATTAGTGSEAGIRSLITDPVKGNKIAVESPHMIADFAVLDPELTYSVPPAVTAATGVDAMAHCVEAFTNRRAHPMIDGFARMGFHLVGKYLARAVKDGSDTEAREGLCLRPTTVASALAQSTQQPDTLLPIRLGRGSACRTGSLTPLYFRTCSPSTSRCGKKTDEVAWRWGWAKPCPKLSF